MKKISITLSKEKEVSSNLSPGFVDKLKRDKEIIEKSMHNMNNVNFMLVSQITEYKHNPDIVKLSIAYGEAWNSLEELVQQIRYSIVRLSKK